MSRARLCTGWWPLLLIGMSVHASLSATPAAAVTATRQQEAADLCLQYVSVRLGHLMGLHVMQTKAHNPLRCCGWSRERTGRVPRRSVLSVRYATNRRSSRIGHWRSWICYNLIRRVSRYQCRKQVVQMLDQGHPERRQIATIHIGKNAIAVQA